MSIGGILIERLGEKKFNISVYDICGVVASHVELIPLSALKYMFLYTL